MIHYHGLPITPDTAAVAAVAGGHAFVSFHRPDQVELAIEEASSFAVDNGAFSAWKSGNPITDWCAYYAFVSDLMHFPGFDFAVIPDVIDGDEAANDALVDEWGRTCMARAPGAIGAPVWHMHESMERLGRLVSAWPRVCIGSSGQYSRVGSTAWWGRMALAAEVFCDDAGRPRCKIHGLRMLDVRVIDRIPFASADSTNIARNVGIDSRWKGTYAPTTKAARAAVMRQRIESFQSPPTWTDGIPIQHCLFDTEAA